MRKPLLAAALLSAQPAIAQTGIGLPTEPTATRSPVLVKPSVGSRNVATAGDVMLSQRNVRWIETAKIEGTYSSPPQVSNKFEITGSEILRQDELSNAKFKACTVLLIGSKPGQPCFLDDDGDGNFDRVALNSLSKAHPIGSKLPYVRLEPEPVELVPSGFSRTLLYQGVNAGTLNLSYREFKDDLARPAFEEALTIPLSTAFPQKFAVKGAIFTIFKIDGLGIEYSVDKYGNFASVP